MNSSVFSLESVRFSSGRESVLRGGRDLFPRLHDSFSGIKQIGFIGWGSQGPAQAQNLRDTLAEIGSEIIVKIGLQEGSKSLQAARDAGFSEENGTLGNMFEVAAESDFVILLISDGAQTELWARITSVMKPGSTLGLSHGFLIGYLESVGQKLRNDINVIMMAPKGMGRSVRRLYVQGKETDGAGINASVAVEQDVDGWAFDIALGWAVGVGSPATFITTMKKEVVSDLFGERAMLLGGLWGASEALYRYFRDSGASQHEAFLDSAKGLTSTITRMISEMGLVGTYQEISMLGFGDAFDVGFSSAHPMMKNLMCEIYAEVSSLREIGDVVSATAALKNGGVMPDIEASEMWGAARDAGLYTATAPMTTRLAFAAGVYIAGIMAQMEILRENGHCTSEIVNESLIEAIDSLNPFMDLRGVSFMVDNCSTTARLGTRKWGKVFVERIYQALVSGKGPNEALLKKAFFAPIHKDIDICYSYRPAVKIAVE